MLISLFLYRNLKASKKLINKGSLSILTDFCLYPSPLACIKAQNPWTYYFSSNEFNLFFLCEIILPYALTMHKVFYREFKYYLRKVVTTVVLT